MLLPRLSLLSLASAHPLMHAVSPQQIVVSEPPPGHDLSFPTIHESAVMARRILHLSSHGTLVTTFPVSPQSIDPRSIRAGRPPEVEGDAIGLLEYYADCEPETGNPTLLAIDIATPFRNYEAGSNISLSIRWWPDQSESFSAPAGNDIPTPHTPAALPRFSLHGFLEHIPDKVLAKKSIPACFLKTHPDSVIWQPGNDVSHESKYLRFVVEHVYWFGGFGDRARIEWLPVDEWRAVTMEEIATCRLPGETKDGGHGRRRTSL